MKDDLYSQKRVFDKYQKIEEVCVISNGKCKEKITRPCGAVIVPRLSSGNYLLLIQYRAGVSNVVIEAAAGKLEEGESFYENALRELEEETGAISNELMELGSFYVSPSFSDEYIKIYIADNIESLGKQKLDFDEIIEREIVSISDLKKDGNWLIKDMRTLLGIIMSERVNKRECFSTPNNIFSKEYDSLKLKDVISKRVYDGNSLKVDEKEIKFKNNSVWSREVVSCSNRVTVIARNSSNRYALVSEDRGDVIGRKIWQAPCDILREGEIASLAASRILKEKSGYKADSLKFINDMPFYVSCGWCNEERYIFLAEGLEKIEDRENVKFFSMEELKLDGRWNDAELATALGIELSSVI